MGGVSKRPTLKLGTSLVWELEATGSSYAIGAGPTYRVSLDLFSGGWLVEASHWDRGERCWVDTALDPARTRAFVVAFFRDGCIPRDLVEIDAIAAGLETARASPWPAGLSAPGVASCQDVKGGPECPPGPHRTGDRGLTSCQDARIEAAPCKRKPPTACPKIAGAPVTVDATKTDALFDGNE